MNSFCFALGFHYLWTKAEDKMHLGKKKNEFFLFCSRFSLSLPQKPQYEEKDTLNNHITYGMLGHIRSTKV